MIPSLLPSAVETSGVVLLVVGKIGEQDAPIIESLESDSLKIVTATALDAVRAVRQQAPHVVLLVGDATVNAGQAVLRLFSRNSLAAVVPVIMLVESISEDDRARAQRNGVLDVILPRLDSNDTKADLSSVIQKWSRTSARDVESGQATLDELSVVLRQELRSGVFTVERRDETGGTQMHRMVLATGMTLPQLVDAFVARLKPLVQKTQTLTYRFENIAASRIRLGDGRDPADAKDEGALRDLRVAILATPEGDARSMRETFADLGTTAESFGSAATLETIFDFSPDLAVFDSRAIETSAFDLFEVFRRDRRGKWTAWVFLDPSEFRGSQSAGEPPQGFDPKRLASRIAPLFEADRAITDRARIDLSFFTRLDTVGPLRLLRALARSGSRVAVRFESDNIRFLLDVEGEVLTGIEVTRDGVVVDPERALRGFLGASIARVQIDRRPHAPLERLAFPIANLRIDAPTVNAADHSQLARLQLVDRAESSLKVVEEVHAPRNRDARISGPPSDSIPEPPLVVSPPSVYEDEETLAQSRARNQDSESPPIIEESATQMTTALSDEQVVTNAVAMPEARVGTISDFPKPLEAEAKQGDEDDSFDELSGVATKVRFSERPDRGESEPPTATTGRPILAEPSVITDSSISLEAGVRTPQSLSPAIASKAPIAPQSEPALNMDQTMPPLILSDHPSDSSGPPAAQLSIPSQPALPADAQKPPPLREKSGAAASAVETMRVASLRAGPEPSKRARRAKRAKWTLIVGAAALLGLGAASVGLVAKLLPKSSTTSPRPPAAPRTPTPLPEVPAEPGPTAPSTPPAPEPEAPAAAAPVEQPSPPAPPTPTPQPEVPTAPAAEPTPQPEAIAQPASPTAPAATPPTPQPEATGAPTANGDQSAEELVDEAESIVSRDAARAEQLFRRALELDNDNPHALSGLAKVLIRRGDATQAIRFARRAVEVRGRRASYRVVLGDAYAAAGDRAAAEAAWNEALRLEPNHREASERLGR